MCNANLLKIMTTPATLYVMHDHRGVSFAHRFLRQCRLVSACAAAEREGPYSTLTYMILRTRIITPIVPRHWTVIPLHPGGARYASYLLYTLIFTHHFYSLLIKLLVVTLALL